MERHRSLDRQSDSERLELGFGGRKVEWTREVEIQSDERGGGSRLTIRGVVTGFAALGRVLGLFIVRDSLYVSPTSTRQIKPRRAVSQEAGAIRRIRPDDTHYENVLRDNDRAQRKRHIIFRFEPGTIPVSGEPTRRVCPDSGRSGDPPGNFDLL
ncbi:hypothetical protein EVAR_7479_1 [Eumeta japonica]|uniref:Uncharacterized protein n=1 Tax=Eumeta variegata TaxID=151549 RepID=A0A4C1Y4B9_EUMVA|nr:hypothetical protein EVAR_7479_1 [Eumeta japonica]